MSPVPDPIATKPTAAINNTTIPSAVRDAQRARGSAGPFGVSRDVFMALVMAAACGIGLSIALLSAPGVVSTAKAGELRLAAFKAPDLTGRWTGQPRGYAETLKACGPDGCTLTLDVAPCGDTWCGVRVEKDGTCAAGQALKMSAKKRDAVADAENDETPAFEGKLELASNTQPYVIEAYFWTPEDTGTPQLRIIGDTGGEMLMLRRSFPLQATLARTGDAKCNSSKPVS